GGSQVYTGLNPNSSLPDVMSPNVPPPPLATKRWCSDRPELGLPCIEGASDTATAPFSTLDHTAAARSRHEGGVNILLGLGSVRFVSENIDHGLWVALSTIAAGEILGEF